MTGHNDARQTDRDGPVAALKETYRLIAQGRRALANAMDSLEKDIRDGSVGHAEAMRRLEDIKALETCIQGAWQSAEGLLHKMGKYVE